MIMKKIFLLFIASFLLVSCKNKVSNTVISESNNVITSEEQEYRTMDDADKELRDSIDYSQYNPDENGICEGTPELYKAKNTDEDRLISSLDDYYKAAIVNDVQKAKSYICPKVFFLAREKFPQSTNEEIDDIVTSSISDFPKFNDALKQRFEGFKKTVPFVSQLNKLKSKDGCLLYSLHYSTVILCTTDDKKYYAWHIPMFMYAASSNNGKNWYFIELTEDTNEILKEFR